MATFGFIGAGNMATAIIDGMLAAGRDPESIMVTDPAEDRIAPLKDKGVRSADSAGSLAESCDFVILAVKPQVLPAVLPSLSSLRDGAAVVSIAAGITLARLSEGLAEGTAIIRVMPNVNAQIGAGMAAVTANAAASEDQVAEVLSIFNAVGRAVVLQEKDFSAFTAIASSAPALVFDFIDALARGGVKHGIPKALGVEIATQCVLGSASLVLQSLGERTPADLSDTVTSPGGTTIAGLVAAEAGGFTAAVVDFVDAAVARDKELG